MTDLLSLLPEEIARAIAPQPTYRADQIFAWLHKGVSSFADMTNLPKALREELAQAFPKPFPKALVRQQAKDGTQKVLFSFHDGESVETVVMSYAHGRSVCLSTQAGCRMGCAFCASTTNGLRRQLTAGEMLAQYLAADAEAGHIVLMGMGEPLDNLDQVLRFITLVTHEKGRNLSMRNVSLSTCGLLPGLQRLTEEALPITLSVSLHAPDDETRTRLMPVNKATGVDALLAACRSYFKATGRRISFEYILIDSINDSMAQAKLLGEKLKGMPVHINLIPLNETEHCVWKASNPTAVKRFSDTVAACGHSVTVRRRLGGAIDAACGQLRGQTTSARSKRHERNG